MSRLLYRLSYTALMRSDPRLATGDLAHQSPNTESNRRPSPYHGDALPTELLGRAMKTLHGPPPIAQIRFAAPAGPRPDSHAAPATAPAASPAHRGPHRYDYCAPPRPARADRPRLDSRCVILRLASAAPSPAQPEPAGARCPTASRSHRPRRHGASRPAGHRPPLLLVRRPAHRRPHRGRTARRRAHRGGRHRRQPHAAPARRRPRRPAAAICCCPPPPNRTPTATPR